MHENAPTHNEQSETGSAARRGNPERSCIVLKESGPRGPLIRFVLSPDFVVTPDLAEKLPGRGFYVTADPALIEQAIAKKLFARAAKHQCTVPDGLIDQIKFLLADRVLNSLGLAKKAGLIVLGEDGVADALKARKLGGILFASDVSPRTSADIARAAEGRNVPTYALNLDAAAFGAALGRNNAVYVGLLAGKMAENLLRDCARLAPFVTSSPGK